MVLSIGVAVMCVVLAIGVICVILPRIGSAGALGVFLRVGALSGAVSVGAAVLDIMASNGAGDLTRIAADTTMILAPALLCAALVVTPDRPLTRSLPIAVAVAAVAALGFTLAPAAVTTIKAFTLALACGLCAVLAFRASALPRRSRFVLTTAMGAYALYSTARGVLSLESDSFDPVFSPTGVIVAGISAMLLTGVSIVIIGLPSAGATAGGRRRGASISIGDWNLATAAFGRERVRVLLLDLRRAARDLDPSTVDSLHGVEISVPSAISALRERLAADYGWRPEEVELLTDATPRRRPRITV
ncbi:hypothetical protein AB6V29_04365 [Microbacterium sp. 20-116]|uniref:hypothetical protein n=1 Tax=Microbacterium sp. 20-116 TaxID=3239883 RepID=UPI0034E25A44